MRAVFIGASNVAPGTWPERLSSAEGWRCHNYAVGGTYFDWDVNPDSFLSQLERANTDPALPNGEVGFVFVAGGGNDIRQNRSVKYAAWRFHERARVYFPNARIISIPALWNDKGTHPFLFRVANEMRDAALAHGHEVVWQSWTWLMGHPEWMADPVHPNAAGYGQFVQRISTYLDGGNVTVNHADEWSLPAGVAVHDRGIVRCVCIDGIVYLTARLRKTSGTFALGETVMKLPAWAAASQSGDPRPIAGGLTAMDRHAGFYVYSDGRVTVRAAGGNEAEVNIASACWPIGV